MASGSRNDIFKSSWRPATPPAPPPLYDDFSLGSGRQLGRSKTTGAAWRSKVRSTLDPQLFAYHPPHPTSQDDTSMTPRPESSPLPVLVISASEAKQSSDDDPGSSSSKTLSFFDLPSRFHGPSLDDTISSPALSASTASLSHASSTHSSSNPSLSAPLPFAGKTGPASALPVDQDPSLDVELRLISRKEFLLGAGRYSNVYLASYRRERGKDDWVEPDEEGCVPRNPWTLCAVKKLHEDEESQRLGLREAWFLRQLAASAVQADGVKKGRTHPGQVHVVRLLGIKREDGSQQLQKPRGSWPQSSMSLLHQALEGRAKHPLIARHSRHASLEDDLPPLHIPSSNSLTPFSPAPTPERELLLVLPYAPSVLSQVIHSKPYLLTAPRHTRIALQLSQAVAFIHSQSILHTDIKPHNVLLTSSFDVLLGDFNTAIHLPSTSLSSSVLPVDPAGLGTPVYSPPEFNRPPPSPFSFPVDIWALGVTLMVGILGREPYAGLVDGTRGKGGSGGRHLELKMWLRKGAYWQWEEQERVERLEDGRRLWISSDDDRDLNDDGDDGGPRKAIGKDQLMELLGPGLVNDTPTRLDGDSGPTPEVKEKPELSGDPYDDGSPALFYLGTPTARVSQRILGLLRSICSTSQTSRPSIETIIRGFEEELASLQRES